MDENQYNPDGHDEGQHQDQQNQQSNNDQPQHDDSNNDNGGGGDGDVQYTETEQSDAPAEQPAANQERQPKPRQSSDNNNSGKQLDKVKRRALNALVPLIGSMDVDAQRKFDICMNAIRFTDNRDLVSTALDAALAIEEKGAKAEALVELVNEINYLQQPTA